ncbi:hypothetical protein NQ317_018809, partial [Molorchus minor]
MPISEDEYDSRSQEPQSTMSKAELRKTHKPIMEKRRRARINQCLNEIKSLILEAMNKDPARHSKLEKADILEMAVKHLQNVQRQQLALAMATDPSILRKFKTGFNECSTEIERYINQVEGVDTAMKQRISSHLQKCISGIEQVSQLNFPGISNLPFLSRSSVFAQTQARVDAQENIDDQKNNPKIQIPQGIQLIPSRLPSGELALLVPNSRNIPYFPTAITQNANKRLSAFAAVVPQAIAAETVVTKPVSPPLSPLRSEEVYDRNTSPQGFRPVISSRQKPFSDDHQVPHISSTVSVERLQLFQLVEVKSPKFPLLKDAKAESPKKTVEPLCIITNQSERYKQAQIKMDSAHYEENFMYQGIKRKYQEVSHNQGLLAVAHSDFNYKQPTKIVKTRHIDLTAEEDTIYLGLNKKEDYHRLVPTTEASQREEVKTKEEAPSGSKDTDSESNCDMWRP